MVLPLNEINLIYVEFHTGSNWCPSVPTKWQTTQFVRCDERLLKKWNYTAGAFTLAYSGTGTGDQNRDRKNGLYEIIQNISHYTGVGT